MTRQQGFSLVEVLVGLAILTLGVIGLSSLAVSMIRGNVSVRCNDDATRLAQSKLEEVRNAGYDAASVVTTSEVILRLDGELALPFGRFTTVNQGPLPNTRNVTVMMTWYQDGPRQSVFSTEIVQDASAAPAPTGGDGEESESESPKKKKKKKGRG